MNSDIKVLLNDKTLDKTLQEIAHKVSQQERISPEEGLYLYDNAPLGYLGALANHIRERRHGDKTYFNRNFHMEPTNVCVYTCTFCSYSRLIKKRSEGWELTHEGMMDIVKKYDGKPVTEVHIVGGVLPQYDFDFYIKLFKAIKEHRPELHIKGLTPVEYHYVFKKAKISYEEGMKAMVEAGLDSMPGGGARFFILKFGSKLRAANATATNGCALTKFCTAWASAPMLPCCMDILRRTNTAWITWNRINLFLI